MTNVIQLHDIDDDDLPDLDDVFVEAFGGEPPTFGERVDLLEHLTGKGQMERLADLFEARSERADYTVRDAVVTDINIARRCIILRNASIALA